jgi:NAD(P)-dependent dehydrogenase (short-subunit alcohol dehydrogenase family)
MAQGRLKGQAALVTGGSRGIGLAIAAALAREGANLLLVATSEERLAAAQRELAGTGVRVETFAADVSDRVACVAAVQKAITLFGQLEVLVNGAGVYAAKGFLDYATEDFERLLRVNLLGPVHLMQAALPHMVERGYGRIVNIASTAGKWASRNQSAYNISKHAVVGLTRCTALEFAAQGVTINAICPGMVETDMVGEFLPQVAKAAGTTPEAVRADLYRRIAQGRFLDPAECGPLAVYLASPESRGMTGQSVVLDGGMVFV